uniref:Uncharacterized protein n=1 Tax=Anguilla anguilla TaxID=7936 RepID=A0A0E9UX84_ANGAN
MKQPGEISAELSRKDPSKPGSSGHSI